MKQDILEFIISYGISLEESGTNSFAFHKDKALLFLEKLKEYEIVVLGGDVLKKDNEKFVYIYDNWSYQNKNVLESIEKAKNFITTYVIENDYIDFVLTTDFFKQMKEA